MPNKLPFNKEIEEEGSPLKVINLKRTKSDKEQNENEPLSLGPPEIESDEENKL